MRRFIALSALPFALLLVAAGLAQAQSASFSACLRAAGSNAVESTLCRQRELARQDRRLNDVYNALARRLPLGSQQRLGLKADQLAWIAARDATCGQRGVIDVDCLIEMTRERADEIAAQSR